MASTQHLNYLLTFTSLVGLCLSIYAYTVEINAEKDNKYVAMCDINEHMSCTKAFKSIYGRGLGLFPKDSFFNIPNCLVGIIFYIVTAALAQSNSPLIVKLSYWSIILSNLSSLYFAYILYFKLYDFCIVCICIYVVNIFCLVFAHLKLANMAKAEIPKKAN